jgi:four helix bundle protein
MNYFTDLKAWQKGMLLVSSVYAATETFPRTELYGLTSQLKRSSTSILANIAEGHGRFSFADKTHKFIIARGECTEVIAFLHIAEHLGFLHSQKAHAILLQAEEIGRILSGLIKACKKRSESDQASTLVS